MVADSVTSLLDRFLDALQRKDCDLDGDCLYMSWLEHCDIRGPEMIFGEIPEEVPSSLQMIYVNDATSPVDLAPLTASSNLRILRLNGCATADLTPIRAVPVEFMHVSLEGGDLTPLQGHRHLASLDLGTSAPIDIAPLCTVPNLRSVDLSAASVRDLTVLADMPDLRYLALTPGQWTTLLDGGKVPPALAAARLADDEVSLDEALTWSARLGLDAWNAFRIAGMAGSGGG